MALYTKQDFAPPILSRRWLAMKFRPNMLIYNRAHVLSILESGLLFREDSIEVEQEAPGADENWRWCGGGRGGWLTKGEGAAAGVAVVACVAAFPPRNLHRSALLNLLLYISVPALIRFAHRALVCGALANMLASMRDYLALARRAAACLKEYAALHAQLGSITSAIESTHKMLCRQQGSLSVTMSRASSALLGNAPWLRADVAWDALATPTDDNLMKIHHAFLVVQSTLLKHIAMAHFVPPAHAQKTYKNHNERLYWLHTVLIANLNEEFKQNYESLERMYRLLKNFGNSDKVDVKKPGTAMLDSWVYSDIHNGVARTNLELKLVANKCNTLDIFLDSCALNKQTLDLSVLSKDIDEIIDDITKCLNTVQNSQIRLKKIRNKFEGVEKETELVEKVASDNYNLIQIDDKEPEIIDEVFYFVRTDDDVAITPANDVTTGPGKKEKETTKIVLKELKRQLGKREDVMRERERQALAKTMPEFKDHVPEFPRQIKLEEFVVHKGFLTKIKQVISKKLFRNYRIKKTKKNKKYKLKMERYRVENEIPKPFYEANANLNFKSKLITIYSLKNCSYITKWSKQLSSPEQSKGLDSSGMSDLSAVEASTDNIPINQVNNVQNGQSMEARNFRYTKKDLELSPSSSESDFEFYKAKQLALLKDVRRHRSIRRKNHPDNLSLDRSSENRSIDKEDESLKPMEYTFGTGMAMASMLQVQSNLPLLAQEEVFIGDGEVSNDSGNDEDA